MASTPSGCRTSRPGSRAAPSTTDRDGPPAGDVTGKRRGDGDCRASASTMPSIGPVSPSVTERACSTQTNPPPPTATTTSPIKTQAHHRSHRLFFEPGRAMSLLALTLPAPIRGGSSMARSLAEEHTASRTTFGPGGRRDAAGPAPTAVGDPVATPTPRGRHVRHVQVRGRLGQFCELLWREPLRADVCGEAEALDQSERLRAGDVESGGQGVHEGLAALPETRLDNPAQRRPAPTAGEDPAVAGRRRPETNPRWAEDRRSTGPGGESRTMRA